MFEYYEIVSASGEFAGQLEAINEAYGLVLNLHKILEEGQQQ